jgi:hypothetical protein
MSLLAGGLTGALAFVLFRRLFGPGPALLAVPIILTSAVFATYAITAMTDVPFVLLCLIVMIAITSEGPHRLRAVILSGVLLRHRLPDPVQRRVPPRAGPGVPALWGERRWSSRARSGPRTSQLPGDGRALAVDELHPPRVPLLQHELRGRGPGVRHHPSTPFTSLADVLLDDPARFARRYVANLGYTFFQTLGAGLALLPVGPLAAIGIG